MPKYLIKFVPDLFVFIKSPNLFSRVKNRIHNQSVLIHALYVLGLTARTLIIYKAGGTALRLRSLEDVSVCVVFGLGVCRIGQF